MHVRLFSFERVSLFRNGDTITGEQRRWPPKIFRSQRSTGVKKKTIKSDTLQCLPRRVAALNKRRIKKKSTKRDYFSGSQQRNRGNDRERGGKWTPTSQDLGGATHHHSPVATALHGSHVPDGVADVPPRHPVSAPVASTTRLGCCRFLRGGCRGGAIRT